MSAPRNVRRSRVEFAAVERGYEYEAEWTEDRSAAELDVRLDRAAALDSYLIRRTVVIYPWRSA